MKPAHSPHLPMNPPLYHSSSAAPSASASDFLCLHKTFLEMWKRHLVIWQHFSVSYYKKLPQSYYLLFSTFLIILLLSPEGTSHAPESINDMHAVHAICLDGNN